MANASSTTGAKLSAKTTFQEESLEDAVDALGSGKPHVERGSFLELVNQLGSALNGTCHEFGKEGDKEAVMDEFALGLEVAPVDVDGVTDGLEGVEADSKWQQDVPIGQCG